MKSEVFEGKKQKKGILKTLIKRGNKSKKGLIPLQSQYLEDSNPEAMTVTKISQAQ